MKVEELGKWATGILDAQEKQYLEQGAAWTMPAEWRPNRGVECATMKVLTNAYRAEKTKKSLDAVATAMQAWRGVGRDEMFDNLDQGRLREHFKWSKDPKVAKAGIAKGRLRAAIVPVVALVKRHGKELRRLLRMDDEERAEVPTVMQENATLKRRVDEAQQAAEAEKKRRKVAENKVSQYGRRLKSKQKAVSDARKAWAKKTAKEKAEEREKRKQQVKEWREKNVTRLQEQATKGAWKDVQGKVDDMKKELAGRCARAIRRRRQKSPASGSSVRKGPRASWQMRSRISTS